MNDFLLVYLNLEGENFEFKRLCYYAAGTYIPYTNFYFCKFHLSGTTLDVTGVNNLPVW
jgi:hypothetical protein